MQRVCQSGCYYITIPNLSHPLGYFKCVYKLACLASRLWLKGGENLFRIGHRCAKASKPMCISFITSISKTDRFWEISIHENHRLYY